MVGRQTGRQAGYKCSFSRPIPKVIRKFFRLSFSLFYGSSSVIKCVQCGRKKSTQGKKDAKRNPLGYGSSNKIIAFTKLNTNVIEVLVNSRRRASSFAVDKVRVARRYLHRAAIAGRLASNKLFGAIPAMKVLFSLLILSSYQSRAQRT